MNKLVIRKYLSIGNKWLIYNRKFLKFPQRIHRYLYCSQIKEQQQKLNIQETEIDDEIDDDDIDIDQLKHEMFEDFESSQEEMMNESNKEDEINNMNQLFEDDNDPIKNFNLMDDDKNDTLSFAAQQFKKRIEFNKSLKREAVQKSFKSINYSSAMLQSGIPEIIYDNDDNDSWVNYVRLYTYTPFTIGLIFVPIAIFGYPDIELFPKLCAGCFYMGTSALFPYLSFMAVKNKVNKCWLTPDLEKLIIEKNNFFFQSFKNEYLVKDLRVLHKKGSERHCWFQCKKTKHQFLLISELMQHQVWLQLLNVEDFEISDAKLQTIANDGRITRFRGPQ